MTITYLGAGNYKFILEERDYKVAEGYLKKIQEKLEKFDDKISESKFSRKKAEVES